MNKKKKLVIITVLNDIQRRLNSADSGKKTNKKTEPSADYIFFYSVLIPGRNFILRFLTFNLFGSFEFVHKLQ